MRQTQTHTMTFRPPTEYDIDKVAKQLGLSRGKLIRVAVKDFWARQLVA